MKRLLLIIAVFGAYSLNLQAQKLIALQNGSKAFFHQRLDTIMAHAASGDTIYLPGVNYNYGQDFVINKELHIYGVGHQPDSTLATGFTGIQNSVRFVTGSDNSTFSGVYVGGDLYFGTNTTNRNVSNVTISRCNVNQLMLNYGDADGSTNSFITIKENVIRYDLVGGFSSNNIAVERNIIVHYARNFVNPANTYFKNNIFLNNRPCSGDVMCLSNVFGVLLENNVFMQSNPLNAGNVIQSTFKNNLFYANVDFTSNANGTNTGINNVVNVPVDQIFSSYSDTGYCGMAYFDYSFNFRLKATSPGKNAGSDGTDVGLYGTITPYKTIPANPHIVTSNNSDHVINGKLGVNVSVQAQSR